MDRKDDYPVEPEYTPSEKRSPWEDYYYQTGGQRQPPKSGSALAASLLIIAILAAGIVCMSSLMNVSLFRSRQQKELGSASYSEGNRDPAVLEGSAGETEPQQTRPEINHGGLNLEHTDRSPDNVPQTGGLSWQAVYEKAIDSVVSISCAYSGGTRSGTGVIMSSDGYIITNHHVIEKAVSISVLLTDGRTFAASCVGSDAVSDLAVLWIDAEDLVSAEFGDSDSLRVGDAVAAIGDPLGVELRGTMTDGIVSAINRDITTGGRTMTLIQTNAALNSGNSGGPLLNCYGQVIGINTMKIGDYVSYSGVEGLGFAIPSTQVKLIVDQLIANGYVSGRPALGISGTVLSEFYRYYYRLPLGLYITEVAAGSDAEAKGIQPGDILCSLDGYAISSESDLQEILFSHQVGDQVPAVIYRAGKEYRVTLEVMEAKS